MTRSLRVRDAGRGLSQIAAAGAGETIITGQVTAITTSGHVNVRVGEVLKVNVPCLTGYFVRAVGDVVTILVVRGAWFVLGRVHPSETIFVGSTQPTALRMYGGPRALTGATGRQGCSGLGSDTTPITTAWSYWTGTNNRLVDGVINWPGDNVRFWFGRDDRPHGNPDSTQLLVYPHGYDTLPETGFEPLPGWLPMTLTLQLGEAKHLYLIAPEAWVTAIGAGTIRGIAVGGPAMTDPGRDYVELHPDSATFTMD